MPKLFNINIIWLSIGFFGQALFASRFIIQWLASEKVKQSIIPIHFWYCSIGGGLTLLLYAIHRKDPVIIFGQSLGLLVYARNLHFLKKDRKNPQKVNE
jgi:lipid-A-disaccharide synthase-like uncharacterized protein